MGQTDTRGSSTCAGMVFGLGRLYYSNKVTSYSGNHPEFTDLAPRIFYFGTHAT